MCSDAWQEKGGLHAAPQPSKASGRHLLQRQGHWPSVFGATQDTSSTCFGRDAVTARSCLAAENRSILPSEAPSGLRKTGAASKQKPQCVAGWISPGRTLSVTWNQPEQSAGDSSESPEWEGEAGAVPGSPFGSGEDRTGLGQPDSPRHCVSPRAMLSPLLCCVMQGA